eukprot:COSAG02_NODE_4241_length_5596_cov_4.207932_4_plen_176_part_00
MAQVALTGLLCQPWSTQRRRRSRGRRRSLGAQPALRVQRWVNLLHWCMIVDTSRPPLSPCLYGVGAATLSGAERLEITARAVGLHASHQWHQHTCSAPNRRDLRELWGCTDARSTSTKVSTPAPTGEMHQASGQPATTTAPASALADARHSTACTRRSSWSWHRRTGAPARARRA